MQNAERLANSVAGRLKPRLKSKDQRRFAAESMKKSIIVYWATVYALLVWAAGYLIHKNVILGVLSVLPSVILTYYVLRAGKKRDAEMKEMLESKSGKIGAPVLYFLFFIVEMIIINFVVK